MSASRTRLLAAARDGPRMSHRPHQPTLGHLGQIEQAVPAWDAAVEQGRRLVFGPACGKTGEAHLSRPLYAKRLQQFHHPPKYLLQDFSIEAYLRMQCIRFAPHERHACLEELRAALAAIYSGRGALTRIFAALEEPIFNDNPTLQDLYGLFRTVVAERCLSFTPHPATYQEVGFSWFHEATRDAAMDVGGGDVAEAKGKKVPRAVPLCAVAAKSAFAGSRQAVRENSRFVATSRLPTVDFTGEPPAGDGAPQIEQHGVAADASMKAQLSAEDVAAAETRVAAVVGLHGGAARVAVVQLLLGLSAARAAGDVAAAAAEREKFLEAALDDAEFVTSTGRSMPIASARPSEVGAAMREAVAAPHTESLMSVRHRFVDPLYVKRRVAYLDRLTRKKITSKKEERLNTHFKTHPDAQPFYPTNYGAINRRATKKWP